MDKSSQNEGNSTPLKQSSVLKELFKGIYLSIFAFLIGAVLYVIFTFLILAIFEMMHVEGFAALGVGILLGMIRTFGALSLSIIGIWILLSKFHVKRGLLIALFIIVNFLPFYTLSSSLFGGLTIGWNWTFFVFFQLYYFLFKIRKVPLFITLALAIAISAAIIGFIPRMIAKSEAQTANIKSDECFLKRGLQLYAPKEEVGKYRVTEYLGQNYCYESFDKAQSPAAYSLNFGIKAYLFEAPNNYGTDKFCGKETSSIGSSYAPEQHCEKVGKTNIGTDVYLRNLNPSNARVFPESIFTRIGDTVVTLHNLPPQFAVADAIEFFNSLEPATLNRLKVLDSSAKKNFDSVKNSIEQRIDFELYMPSYLPKGVSTVKYDITNSFNPSNPDLELYLKQKGNSDNSGFKIYEFSSSKPFEPEKGCGSYSGEIEDRYGNSSECKLITRSPRGIDIYGNTYDVFFMLGNTKTTITFVNNTELADKDQLVKVVDSMNKVSLDQIKEEYSSKHFDIYTLLRLIYGDK